MDDSVNKVALKVQQRSGFDKSFMSIGSGDCGTIYPIFVDEVIPNSKVNLKLALSASLPPLACDTYLRTSVKCEAFFVPFRLLFGSFEQWFTGVYDDDDKTPAYVPRMLVSASQSLTDAEISALNSALNSMFKLGSLGDYLGMRCPHDKDGVEMDGLNINLLSAVGYHKVWNDWYRNPLIQKSAFVRPVTGGDIPSANPVIATLPYYYTRQANSTFVVSDATDLNSNDWCCHDGVHVFDLRQRNFGDDPFTIAMTSPQLGSAESVGIVTSGNASSFTIASLRAGNSMQQFKEFNQLAGTRLVDQLRVRYNAHLSDGVAQRALLLGTAEFEVYSKGIYQNSDNSSSGRNPYNSVGARYGSAYGSGSEFIINGFTAQEPGFIYVMATLVPRATYGQGINPMLSRYVGENGSITDMATPMLQNVGNEAIYAGEINGNVNGLGNIFGYGQRYRNFMFRNDEVHAALRKYGKLQYFALRRDFSDDEDVEIGTNFLEIPKTYMDTIYAVAPNHQQGEPSFWFDAYFDYKVSQPLAKFSIPSLQNPAYEHGETVVVRRGGISL